MSEIQTLENEVKEYKLQLETIDQGLQNDPDNAELGSLKQEIEEVITLTESAIAELKPTSAPTPSVSRPSPAPTNQKKWPKDNHSGFQSSHKRPDLDLEDSNTPASFSVNDTVTAKWRSGDGGFYTARITSITGSKNDPVYIVKFLKYGTTETLKSRDIKPLSAEARKRKADGISGSSPPIGGQPATTPMNTSVISAAATVDPSLAQQAKREPSKVSDGPIRPAKIPRKVKANKELEQGKSKWQEFAAKGKGSKGKKDSMFRTGDSYSARVGFTGSGKEMSKDVKRERHIYQPLGGEG